MEIDKALPIVVGFLESYLKKMNYFIEKGDTNRKLWIKSIAKTADGQAIQVVFQTAAVFSIHDPAIRRAARITVEAMFESLAPLKGVKVLQEVVQ